MQKRIILILAILFFTLLFGTTTAGNFFIGDINMIDEGQFAAWANHMVHGKLLFRDIYITYGPLSVYPLFYLFKLFGSSAFLVRLYLTLGGTIGIIFAYFITQELKISKMLSILFLTISLLIPAYNMREAAGLFTLLILLKSLKKNSLFLSFISGFLSIITFLISPDFGIFVFIVGILHFIFSFINSNKLKNVFRSLSAYTLGFMLVFVLFIILSLKAGWFWNYVLSTMDIITSISGINVPNGVNFPNPVPFIVTSDYLSFFKFLVGHEMLLYWSLCVYFAALIYLFINFLQKKNNKIDYAFLLVTLFGLFVYSILLTRHGTGHYFYTLPVNLIVTFFLFHKALRVKRKTILLKGMVLLIILYILRILYLNNPSIISFLNPNTYILRIQKEIPNVGFLNISKSQSIKIKSYQKFIEENTKKNDFVYLFNDEPELYMLFDRVNPTKYDLPFIANRIEKRLDVVNDLANRKPKFVFFDRDAWPVDGISNKIRLPEVYSYVMNNYTLYKVFDNVAVYKLN